jgi:acetyl-CoA C-acetyltransferase
MRRVAIVGVGITPRNNAYLADADRKSWKHYVVESAYNAIEDVPKGLDPRDIQYVVANYHGEAAVEAGGIGPVISDILGLHPVGVTVLCANCTGAGVSAHDAYGLVASGLYDRVLVIGFDKRWDVLRFADKRAIGGDVDYDCNVGFDHIQLQALLQEMYYLKYEKRKILEAMVTYRLQMYWYANRNPNATLYGLPCPIESKEELMEIWESKPGSGEINPEFWKKLPGTKPVEGASAFILVPAEEAKQYTDKPVYIDGISYKCNSHLLSSQMYYPVPELVKYDAADFAAPRLAGEEAYRMAKISPDEVDFSEVFEPHISSIIPTLEATQVPPEGKTVDFILDGETALDGRLPTGTDGGRGGLGVTSGSNESDAIYEAVIQMREEASGRQVPKADACVVVGMQGEMASSAVLVLRRD